jgi:hypothetical protein
LNLDIVFNTWKFEIGLLVKQSVLFIECQTFASGHYFESESRRDEPSNFATNVDGNLRGGAPLLDARSHAGELPTVNALGGGQTPEGPLRHQYSPESSTSVFEINPQVWEGGQGQECERGFEAQFHPLVFPEDK